MPNKTIVMVIVYRDRPNQLSEFLETVPPFLEKNGFDYRIIIAEQREETPFNRGFLINLGYLTGRDLFPSYEYTVFTDVDVYPVEKNVTLDYSGVPNGVRHIFCGYEANVGGVVCFHNPVFEAINGFPNNFWGWGHEDFAAKRRLDAIGVTVTRDTTVYRDRPEHRNRFRMYDHPRDKSATEPNKFKAYTDNSRVSGLSLMPPYRETRINITDRIIRCLYHFENNIIY